MASTCRWWMCVGDISNVAQDRTGCTMLEGAHVHMVSTEHMCIMSRVMMLVGGCGCSYAIKARPGHWMCCAQGL